MAWQRGDAPEARFDVITVHFRQAVAPATYELKANLSARQVFDREMKRVTVGWVRKQCQFGKDFVEDNRAFAISCKPAEPSIVPARCGFPARHEGQPTRATTSGAQPDQGLGTSDPPLDVHASAVWMRGLEICSSPDVEAIYRAVWEHLP
ncbi:hypothetical protein [Rhizobium leguminosarum]|uniref:hypothetical protein n=1 Tax=Rhizobium leguminosarum TaxID=384 RepID=UPI000FEC3644|nr:hypothetical protein [Rhizobium leguminosarum]MBY2912277.1 hypothetical protein [Rhizobium leguminosarum]RWX40021.1 hypothetical protein EHI43_00585 [Rhizobium leguminosarum]